MSNYLIGPDALDLSRLTELPLHRMPCRVAEAPDTSARVADTLIARGECTAEDFFFDLDRLEPGQASHIVLTLVGAFKAWHDACIYNVACSPS